MTAAVSHEQQIRALRAIRWSRLSEREREVLDAFMRLGTGKLVADALQINIKTVEAHMAAVRKKTGLRRTVHVARAYERELCDQPASVNAVGRWSL